MYDSQDIESGVKTWLSNYNALTAKTPVPDNMYFRPLVVDLPGAGLSLLGDFFWDGARGHPVNMGTLQRPAEEGGVGLFCVERRNEARSLVWLASYLAPESVRPVWAFLADVLMVRCARVEGTTPGCLSLGMMHDICRMVRTVARAARVTRSVIPAWRLSPLGSRLQRLGPLAFLSC